MTSDPFVEVLGPLRVLRSRIEEVLAPVGLAAVQIAVVPGCDVDGPHELHLVVELAPRPEDVAIDESFERVLRESRQAELERDAKAALEDLESRLRNPGGFLD